MGHTSLRAVSVEDARVLQALRRLPSPLQLYYRNGNIMSSIFSSTEPVHVYASAGSSRFRGGSDGGFSKEDEAERKMEMLRRLEIRRVALTDTMIKRCFQRMKTKKVTFYDASYLAVAFEAGAVLVTADEKFVKKMGKGESLAVLKDLT